MSNQQPPVMDADYWTAADLNPQILWLADAEGNIVSFGPRWLELVGISAEQTLGEGWLTALHPDDREPSLAAWKSSIRTGVATDIEYRVRMKDGGYRWMRSRAAPHRDESGKVVHWYGVLEDVHRFHLTEEALHRSQALARSILDSSDVAIEVLDVNGALVFMNTPGLSIMEVDDFEVIRNRPFARFWPDNVRPMIRDAIIAARHGETVRQTLYGPTAKGSPRWWDISISPIYDTEARVTRILALSRDVTEAKENELAVTANERRLNKVLESTMDKVISIDFNWRVTYLNRRAKAVLPPELAPFVGRDLHELFSGDAAAAFFRRYEQAMADQGQVAFEEYLSSTGKWYEVQAYGTATGLTIFFRDVSERREAQQRIAHLAHHDALTGLANRVQFRNELDVALAQLSSAGALAVLSIDLDDFKHVNDTLGHQAGDSLLEQVGERLRRCVRESDTPARLGGDEFAVLLRLSRPEFAASVARSILVSLSYPFDLGRTRPQRIGASIGIALAPRDGQSTDILLHHADVALYRVKAERGRDYRYFEPEMDKALQHQRQIKHGLAEALERGDLSIVLQPQVSIEPSRITGFEALLRWHRPDGSTVPPAVFIPLAEESGHIDAIGQFVLLEACSEAALWPSSVSVAVNVSPAQFRSRRIVDLVKEALGRSGLDPHRLELEITESVLLDENSDALEDLAEVQRLGVTVALDDFGTGYSSLSYLQRFPFDKLKIDGSFVADLPASPKSQAIVRAIVGLGRSLKIRVIAEGVETWDQLLALRAEGCHEAQGYLFSEPLVSSRARALANTGFVRPEMASVARRIL